MLDDFIFDICIECIHFIFVMFYMFQANHGFFHFIFKIKVAGCRASSSGIDTNIQCATLTYEPHIQPLFLLPLCIA